MRCYLVTGTGWVGKLTREGCNDCVSWLVSGGVLYTITIHVTYWFFLRFVQVFGELNFYMEVMTT